MSASDLLKNNRPSGGVRPSRVRSGYYRPKVAAFDVKSGTSANGPWRRMDFEFEITGPEMTNPNQTVTTKVRHQYFFPKSVFQLDQEGNMKTYKNGNPMTILPELAAMMVAAGAPDGTKDARIVSTFATIDGVVDGVDDTLEAESPEFLEAVLNYFARVMSVYSKMGATYAGGVKYLSGEGGKPKILDAKGKDLYDNPEIKGFLSPEDLEKNAGSFPNGKYDQTRYQYFMSKNAEAGSSDAGAASSQGPRQGAPASRPAIPGRPPARRP